MYFVPQSKNVTKGNVFSVAVRIDTGGDFVNAVQSVFTYPQDKLEFRGISVESSAFDIQAPSSGSNGTVSIARAVIDAVKGDKLVASVSFKALSDAGNGRLDFTSDSHVVKGQAGSTDNADILSVKTSGVYTLVPAPVVVPSPISAPQPSPSPLPPVAAPAPSLPPSPSPAPPLPPEPVPSPTPATPPANNQGRTIFAFGLMAFGIILVLSVLVIKFVIRRRNA